MFKDAIISPCADYRYVLYRIWDTLAPCCLFIMLNPSTADVSNDDPTIKRCIKYATDWGYGSIKVVNLFAYRATKIQHMKSARFPTGRFNDIHIRREAERSDLIVCAWSNHGEYLNRNKEVLVLLSDFQLYYIKMNNTGQPAHPLYLKSELTPTLWSKTT